MFPFASFGPTRRRGSTPGDTPTAEVIRAAPLAAPTVAGSAPSTKGIAHHACARGMKIAETIRARGRKTSASAHCRPRTSARTEPALSPTTFCQTAEPSCP